MASDRKQRVSLRATLMYAFAAMTLLPATVAAISGYFAIDATMNEISRTTISEHGRLARGMLADRLLVQRSALQILADGRSFPADAVDGAATRQVLREALGAASCNYILLLGPSGDGRSSSVYGVRADRLGDAMVYNAALGKAVSGIQVVSPKELAALNISERGEIPLVETKGGVRPSAPSTGALALVSAVPVRDEKGKVRAVLMGVELLNRSTGLVGALVGRLGGTATVFQGVVRVSTTVTNAKGERAIGTWASDVVQSAYAKGNGYVGEALVVETRYVTDYQPISTFTGQKVGMLYVGLPLDPYLRARDQFLLRLFVAIAVCVVGAVLLAEPVARRIVRPVVAVGAAAAQVAGGDLTTEVPLSGNAELVRLGESFNSMTGSLSGMISDVRLTVDGLRAASASILSSSEQQSQTVSRQVAAATETSATLEEMANSYRSVALGAEEVRRVAENALEAAHDGQATLNESIAAADDMHNTAAVTSEHAHEVEEVSAQIGEVLVLIDSIAEQTKILALNAAIEAARAGDAGRGFSVVATEIRTLATSVGQSTARIEEMVHGISAATSKLAKAAERQAALSEKGSQLGHRASDAFDDILKQLSATTAAAAEIAVAAQQQRSAAEQVVLAMQQVTTAASESSAAADEVARVARDVDAHGRTLENGISGFRS